MQMQIVGLKIAVIKVNAYYMLLLGESNIRYFMSWEKTKKWYFTDVTIAFELRMHEMEISDFITSHEQSGTNSLLN